MTANGYELDRFYLGSNIIYPIDKSKVLPNKIWNAKTTLCHAYIVSRNGMKKLLHPKTGLIKYFDELKKRESSLHQDQAIHAICDTIYCHINNDRFDQEFKDTDNIWYDSEFLKEDELKRWFQMKVVIKWMKQCQYFVKLSMMIPFKYRPYIQIPRIFTMQVRREEFIGNDDYESKRYTLYMNSFYDQIILVIWILVIAFFLSPPKFCKVLFYHLQRLIY